MKGSYLKSAIIGIVAVGILAACVSTARVSSARHPNLAEAQTAIESAMAKISAAQAANEFDMNGHAAKAKALLAQAYTEIKLAAVAANAAK
jgi:hypothetical protein